MDQKKELVVSLEKEIFTPALQQAVKAASEKNARAVDIISAAANAYMNMLTVLVGNPSAAADMMKAQAEYLKSADPASSGGDA
jgi:hypothetical protein